MDIKQLKTFLKVAEAGSLSKASDLLRLAQPALSRHIKLLEAELGVPLFIRYGRGMQLTPAGQEFLSRIAGIIQQIEASIADIRSLKSEPQGSVSLGMMPTLSYLLSVRLARRVASELPGVSLRIVEAYAGHLVDWLHRGEIDVSLLYGPGAAVHARTQDLLFEELVLVGSAKEKRSMAGDFPVNRMADLPLVLPSRSHGLRAVVEAAAAKAKVSLNVRFEADSFRVLKDLVQDGLGFTVLPRSAISRELKRGIFQTSNLCKPKVMRQIVLALPADRTDTRATNAVVALLTDEIAGMLRNVEWDAVSAESLRRTPAGD